MSEGYMGINEVLKYLPHRYPFLLVDRVLEIELGKSLIALKNVSHNEPFFTGHFPPQPVMPGVLIVEALAQAAGILTFKTLGLLPSRENWFFLTGIDKARFKRKVEPGDQLKLKVEVMHTRRDLWKFQGVARVDGELAVSVELMIFKETA